MFTLTLNNKPLQLSESKSVRLKWRNPACNFKDFPGDIGWGIEIDVMPYNRALLGNPERFEKLRTGNDEFPGAVLRFKGYYLQAGTLIIQSANKETYSGWLRGVVGNIGKEHREKYIYDVFPQIKNFENKANYDPLIDDYGCPKILNPHFFYDKGPKEKYTRMVLNPDYVPELPWFSPNNNQYIPEDYETEALTEAFRKTAQYFVNQLNFDNTVKVSNSQAYYNKVASDLDVYVVSPMLFLNFILKEIFKKSGFYIDNNALADHPDLKKLMLYNNYDITTIYFTLREAFFGIIYDWYSGETRAHFTDINYIIRRYDGYFQYKNLIPKAQLKDFLLGLQNLLNICFFPRNDSRVDIIDREEILTGTPYELNKYMVGTWQMGEKKDVTLKFVFDHDKDDTFFQENWEDLDDFRDNEGDPVENWEDLDAIFAPELDEIRYVRSKNIYAQYKWTEREEENPSAGGTIETTVLGWEKVSHGFQNGYYNRGKEEEEEIKTIFSTLSNAQPVTAQRGSIKSRKFAYENFTPRLLFYLGNNQGRFETDNISLDWEKETTGLLATRWPKWARFWSTRQPVEGQADLPINVLDYVIRNIPYKFRCREGEFIIEEMECEFRSNEIGTTHFKGYKI